MWITSSLDTVLSPTAAALGNFDGVHRGHRQVISPILPSAARRASGHATVVTFHPHPQEFFSGQPRRLLTPAPEKSTLLADMGVEQLVLLPFDRELARLTPEEFVKQILIQRLQVTQVSVGADFCFGQHRAGSASDLQAIAMAHGIHVTIAPLCICNHERISSSAIRQALQDGNIPRANTLLGHPYTLLGTVTQGQQLGRTLGFPTANLQVPLNKFLPKYGVYAVWVMVGDAPAAPRPGVVNIGYRPTVDGNHETVEVHLLNWSGDLYGQTLRVKLKQFLRPEQKFASLDALKAQIQADCERAQALLVSPDADA